MGAFLPFHDLDDARVSVPVDASHGALPRPMRSSAYSAARLAGAERRLRLARPVAALVDHRLGNGPRMKSFLFSLRTSLVAGH